MFVGSPRPRPRPLRALALGVLSALAVVAPAQAADAPGAPGQRHTWAPADKHGFGSARQAPSTAWFTLRAASLSEIYHPDLSTPAFRGLQFAITDGESFVDRETVDDDPDHIEPVAPGVRATVSPVAGSLRFRQVTRSPGRWRLTKTYIADPARATVLVRVRFEALGRDPLRLYVLADPAPGDDGNDDRSAPSADRLLAFDDVAASAVAASPALSETSSGYRGSESDPWLQLRSGMALTTYDAAAPGNVVQGARTALDGRRHRRMTLAIGFGPTASAASAAADASLARRFGRARDRFDAGWQRYIDSLDAPPAVVARDPDLRRVYRQSLLVLAASEDKLNPGASIAAPNMPWVWGTLTLENHEFSGPYHLVWPRDFYHVATAQKAAGDDAGAARLLDYLWRVQKPDGSWWQNTRVDGTPYWTSLQLDEVALPVVLAWWLGRRGAADWEHVRAAADFIVANGPRTQQERWENQDGFSPNTIATEIAALICAADIARAHGDAARASTYESTADSWAAQVQGWTATTRGPHSAQPYYLRVTKDGNPDDGSTYNLGDNFTRPVAEWEIVDNSFLGLVLFGVKPWDDPVVRNSLAIGDALLASDTASGRIWHRFTFDGYGETATGGDWNIFPTAERQTLGRVWPLLTGERGEYELLAGGDARPHLRTIAATANDGLMLPEQAWDGRPPSAEPDGEGTRSATPLAWTHAQFVRLAWSIAAGEPIERPSIVACRYADEDC